MNPQLRLRIVHILVGDGINTNENVGKRLLKRYGEIRRRSPKTDLRLLLLKCPSHQSNLVVLVAICGELVKQATEVDAVCGTVSRLYKYITPGYLEELTSVLRAFVVSTFELVHDETSAETAMYVQQGRDLVALYGDEVLPDDLMAVLNRNIAGVEHLCPPGANKDNLCKRLFDLLLRLLWKVEDKPVVTRFFLFAPCCFSILRMQLLGLPVELFNIGLGGMETENSKRLTAVKSFYANPDTPQLLRKICLSLRLTLFATSLSSRGNARARALGEPPVLVQLGQAVVQKRTSILFQSIVCRIPSDPILDRTDTLRRLLVTQAHILIRFSIYTRYPTSLWKLVKEFNPEAYTDEIVQFLYAEDSVLDAGYSLLLKKEAWQVAENVEADAVGFLMSSLIQSELRNIFVSGAASTLDVERKHAYDKRFETKKVTGCATASRNSILGRYLVQRKTTVRAKAFAEKKTKSAARMNIRALAFRHRPDLFTRARGRMWWEGDIDKAERSRVVHQGDEQALSEFIDANREDLEEELSEIRRVAKAEAVGNHVLPYSHDEWVSHIEKNYEEFAALLKTAAAKRRPLSHRLEPREEWGEADRIYPLPSNHTGHCPKWSHLKHDFHCFRHGIGNILVCYVAAIGLVAFACPLSSTPTRDQFELLLGDRFHERFMPLPLVMAEAGVGEASTAFWLDWQAVSFLEDRVVIKVNGAEVVERPSSRTVAEDCAIPDVDVDEDRDLEGLMEKLDGDGSDLESLVSSEETEATDEDTEGSGSADEAKSRKELGSCVVYSNGYFTISDNPDYKDLKIRVKTRWCKPGELGTSNMSKTVTPAKFGEARPHTPRSMWVLKSWMLSKAATNDFCNKRAKRRKLFAGVAVEVRAAIIASSTATCPTTGHAQSDNMIRKWCPEILAPVTAAVAK